MATSTKLSAVPAEVTRRSSMPNATVHSQTVVPVLIAVGRRQPRDTSQPATAPTRNGHDVSAMPARVTPSW